MNWLFVKHYALRAFIFLFVISGLLAVVDGYSIALENPASPLVALPPTPLGGQAAHNLGGNFRCAWWSMTLPANVLTHSSTVHCVPFSTLSAPPAPEGYTLLGRTISVNLYNNEVKLITRFNYPITFCYQYVQNDIELAGDPKNFVVHNTLELNGKWKELPTTVDLQAKLVCALTSQAVLVDIAVRVIPKTQIATAPPTQITNTPTPNTNNIYVVKQSDTLYSISKRYNVSIQAIQNANQLNGNNVYIGQTLVIPSTNLAAPASVQLQPTATAATVAAPVSAPPLISTSPTGRARRIPILEYHYSSFALNTNTMMTPQWFENQMKWLHDNSFYALSANELAAYLDGTYTPPQKSVLLTFDLGTPNFDDFNNVIIPTLRKYKLRGSFFVVINMTSDQCTNGYACWDRLREWQNEGLINVQSHGMTHPDYAKSTAQQIQYDAQQSKQILEGKLGTPVIAFAYPYDSAPTNAQSIIKALGYKFGVSGNTRGDKSITPQDYSRFNLPRYYPYSGIGTYPVIYGTTLTFEQMILAAIQ